MIQPENYLVELSEKMTEKLEQSFKIGATLSMMDSTVDIKYIISSIVLIILEFIRSLFIFSATRYDVTARGQIHFQNGFVNKIGNIQLRTNNMQSPTSDIDAWVKAELNVKDLEVFFDVDIETVNYEGSGNILINFGIVTFSVEIKLVYETEKKTQNINFLSATQSELSSKWYPHNPYMQLVARETRLNYYFFLPMTQSFRNWESTLQAHLLSAVSEMSTEFPLICYYCPGAISRRVFGLKF